MAVSAPSEYIEWQDGGPLGVRIHRRVLAGLGREGLEPVSGIVLGAVSDGEMVIEDYARFRPGGIDTFDESLAIGYFRANPGADLQITHDDREFLSRHFAEGPRILLLFQTGNGDARLANVLIEPGAAAVAPAPPPKHRVLYRAETRPPAPPPPKRSAWRFFWPAVAIAAGFGMGSVAYLQLRNESPRAAVVEPAPAPLRITAPDLPTTSAPTPPPTTPAPVTPAPAAPARAPAPAVSEANRSMPSSPRATRADTQQQVRATLNRWREAMLKRDADAFAAFYSPTVRPYHQNTRASRADIAGEVRRNFGRYGHMVVYNLRDITVAPVDANHAIANFRKQWATEANRYVGEEKDQLKLERRGDDWLIASEQELKTYWSRKK